MERPGSGAQARGLRALFRLSRSSGSLVCESSRWHRRRICFQPDRLDSGLHPGTRVSGRSGTRSARRPSRAEDDPAGRARGVPGPCHPIRGETQELDSGHRHRGDLAGNRDCGCSLGRFAFFMNGTGHGFLVGIVFLSRYTRIRMGGKLDRARQTIRASKSRDRTRRALGPSLGGISA